MDTYSSSEARRTAGCSYRQLDYMVREQSIHPSGPPRGSGTQMRWSRLDIAVLTVFVALRRLGATSDTLQPLEAQLRGLTGGQWSARHVVGLDGSLTPLSARSRAAGWMVDLGRLVPTELAQAA